MQRIALRDRPYEREMERAYIDQLNHAYEAFFGEDRRDAPVLRVDTNDLNYVADPQSLKWVENRIRQSLKLPPFQRELPLEVEAGD